MIKKQLVEIISFTRILNNFIFLFSSYRLITSHLRPCSHNFIGVPAKQLKNLNSA